MSQKVSVQLVKGDRATLSEWQIIDKEGKRVISGDEYFLDDSVEFTLDANIRYVLEVSVSFIYNPDTTLYSLQINGEPIIHINSEIGMGDHSFPFFTGVRNNDVKITGGTDADISEFPWQVYYIAGNKLCGGSIISKNWIVTAAHCTKNIFGNTISIADMTIIAGATNLNNVIGDQIYNVSEVIVNENYNSQTLDSDIALLKLKQPIDNINAAPIKIITSYDVAYGATDPGVMSWVTGWGLTNVNPAVYSAILQKVQLPIVSNAQAATVWKNIPPTDIMAGYLKGNKDACNGDSGGPLAVPVFDEYKLGGIVSWGSSDCNTYGGYTRVSDFETWIRTNTGIAKEYRPPSPGGDTVVCQGVGSSSYSIDNIPGASLYEWQLLPSQAGVVSGNSEDAIVSWNTGFTGLVTLIVRVTIDNNVSEWSRLNINIVLNTKLLSQSGDTTICAGQPVSLNVVAEGYNLNYSWYKNSQLIQSGSAVELYISSATTDNSGDYQCETDGFCNIVYSEIINLTVHPQTSISFISPDVEVSFGKDAALEVNAEGHDLTYQWQKNGAILANSNSASLILNNLDATDIGLYSCTATGTCGTETSNPVYLYVNKEGLSDEPEVFLWPSVTIDKFNVALSNDEVYNVLLFNSMGQLIRELTNCRYQTTIDISVMPRGVYILSVNNENFRKSLRIIKQ